MYLIIIASIIGGFLPACIWLWFWLQEDNLHPEPRRMIVRAFIAGICMVPLAFVFQQLVAGPFLKNTSLDYLLKNSPYIASFIIIAWAAIEEILKYIGAYVSGLRSKEDDEPIDAVMYLITTALGFAAAENALFLFGPLLDGDMLRTLITGNLRFIGATLLHIASSGIVGLFLAFSFYKHGAAKKRIVGTALILAIVLHVVFNLFIMFNASNTFYAFTLVWSVIVFIILMLEKVKLLADKN